MGVSEASETITKRLEMVDIGRNLGKKRECQCEQKETTEHIVECKVDESEKGNTIKRETDDIGIIRKVNA